ncbi:MAG: CAP domain-containing protein [Vulcanimicrobiaceae bacterium]
MKFKAITYALLAACALAACGGGGGGGGGGGTLPTVAGGGGGGSVALPTTGPSSQPGGSGSPTPSPNGSATPAPGGGGSGTPAPGSSSSPAPGTTPTPIPTGYFATGYVHDFDSGAAIAGAKVVIEPQVVPGSTPPPNATASATTAADGSFTVTSLLPGSNYLEVFENGYATLHEKFNITSFDSPVGTVNLTRLTSDQLAWLAQVNTDRAHYNASPLVFDEILEEGARHWAGYMSANGWYQTHCPPSDPSCQNAVAYEQTHGGTYTSTGSNIDAKQPPSTWQNAEADFMAQANNCPPPVNPSTCPTTTTTQQFLNLVNNGFIWIGLAIAPNGHGTTTGTFADYYDAEFGTPYQGSQTQSARRHI